MTSSFTPIYTLYMQCLVYLGFEIHSMTPVLTGFPLGIVFFATISSTLTFPGKTNRCLVAFMSLEKRRDHGIKPHGY